MHEVEVKLRSTPIEHGILAKRLKDLGFQKVVSDKETNVLYEHPAIPIKEKGYVFRLRTTAKKTTLTFKGKKTENKHGFKVREEHEVEVSDKETTINILAALGFAADITIEKKRTAYRKGSVEVDLDVVHQLGCFIEIEGKEKRILATLQALGLDQRERITEGYATLLRRKYDGEV